MATIRESRGRTYLSGTTITDKHKLEGRDLLCGSVGHGCWCEEDAVRVCRVVAVM